MRGHPAGRSNWPKYERSDSSARTGVVGICLLLIAMPITASVGRFLTDS